MKVIFVHVPKAAGGSIHTWLRDNSKEYQFQYVTGHKTLEQLQSNFISNLNFTCIRNTYTRMISLYVFSKYKITKKLEKAIQKNNKIEIKKNTNILEKIDKGIIYYLDWAYENNLEITWPLKYWIKDVRIVLRQENLLTDFKIIQEKLNCYNPLPTTAHKMDYSIENFFTADYIKLIEKLYYDEINYFEFTPLFKY